MSSGPRNERIRACLVRIASKSRWFVVTVFAVGAFASRAPGQLASPPTITGVYNGSYAGDQGPVKFKLSITQQSNGTLTGVFTLYPTGSAGTTSYTCDIRGRYLQVNRQFQLRGSKWETVGPANLGMMGMNGTFDPDGGQGAGQISGKMLGRPGPDFEAIRDAAESANMASVTATAPPRPVIAQQGSQPTAGKPAAPKPPSSSAPGTEVALRHRHRRRLYGHLRIQPRRRPCRPNFTFKFIDNGSVNGILDGLFTFDVTPSPEAKSRPRHLQADRPFMSTGNQHPVQFTTAEPLGNPRAGRLRGEASVYASSSARLPTSRGATGNWRIAF
jgi:hypothetical protein